MSFEQRGQYSCFLIQNSFDAPVFVDDIPVAPKITSTISINSKHPVYICEY